MKGTEGIYRQLAHDRLAERFDGLMNPYDIDRRLEVLIDDFLSGVDLRDRVVLDAGCGTGRGVGRLVKRGARVLALDVGRNLLVRTAGRHRCAAVQATVTALPLADDSVFVVFSSEVVEHTPDPLAAVREMVRVLQAGGYLVLSTPNRLWQEPVRMMSRLGLRPYAGLENFVTPTALRGALASLDGRVVAHRGVHLVPFQATALQPLSRRIDAFGTPLLPVMINQCVCFVKGRSRTGS